MSLLQLKVREQGQFLEWRPGQAGYWLPAGRIIEHGDLTVYLSNGGGEVAVKVFKGRASKPLCREVIRRNGTYVVGSKKIKKM